MHRINRLREQLCAAPSATGSSSNTGGADATHQDIHVSRCDVALDASVYDTVLTPEALAFVAELATTFARDINELHQRRAARRLAIEQQQLVPTFLAATRAIRDDAAWRVDPIPLVLQDRRVDIGDVSPANRTLLLRALNSGAQGVQVDFDDGHCPTWTNTLRGHRNLMDAVRNTLARPTEQLLVSSTPALLLVRPRAWNMDEMNMLVHGVVVPGAVFDFGVHLFHNGKLLFETGRGPFLYLPKLESHHEAALWRRLFEHTEAALALPQGSIKATVLIENVFAAVEMDEILYELRRHAIGLNCGMWDYTASVVVLFRTDRNRLLPDRQQSVSMRSAFLQHYMTLLIQTCKRRGAVATTGMVPVVLDALPSHVSRLEAVAAACAAKRSEAVAGSDGALVFDVALVASIQDVFTAVRTEAYSQPDSISGVIDAAFYERILLELPTGSVTTASVASNLRVALLFVLAWLRGDGTVIVNGCVEDSATAEISRAQVAQWLYHRVPLDDVDAAAEVETAHRFVNATLVRDLLLTIAREQLATDAYAQRHVVAALNLVFRVVTMRTPASFLTTFLLEQEPLRIALEH